MGQRIKIGLIRVLTTEDTQLRDLHGRLIEAHFPELEVVSRCIPDQPKGIHDDETEAAALPKIVALGKALERDGVKAVIVSCAADPAADLLREALSIPVIGAGESTACAALRYGERIGVLGIIKEPPPPFIRILGERIVDHEKPLDVGSTLDLMTEWGRQRVIERALDMKENGVQVIALACTGMATIGIAPELERVTGLPVLDPVLCEGAFALLELIRHNQKPL